MKQNPALGFSLALLAAITWGTLPIAAQQVLKVIDAQTLVWARFVVAIFGLLLILGFRKKLPQFAACSAKEWKLLLLGVIGLSANFFLFAEALYYVSPTTNQVLWQLAPFTMIICGIFFFKEQFGRFQKIGFVLLIIGLTAFFNNKFNEILQFNAYAFGVMLSAGASLIWVCYGIAQKLLLKTFSSQQILFIIYIGCAFTLLPFSSPTQLNQLDSSLLWGCFIYCCLNTLIGYGAYGEALNHWDTSKVSIVTTTLPIFTMIFSAIGHALYPDLLDNPDMNCISYIGTFIVVTGAILAIAGDKLFSKTE